MLLVVGRDDDARAELGTATPMLRDMGMAFRLPEAQALLAVTDIGTSTAASVPWPTADRGSEP